VTFDSTLGRAESIVVVVVIVGLVEHTACLRIDDHFVGLAVLTRCHLKALTIARSVRPTIRPFAAVRVPDLRSQVCHRQSGQVALLRIRVRHADSTGSEHANDTRGEKQSVHGCLLLFEATAVSKRIAFKTELRGESVVTFDMNLM
jgi:hypothetical protein